MKRVLLLAVAACGPHPAPTPASPVELAVKLQRDPEREVDPVLDIKAGMASSIADVWTAHEPRVQPPLVDAGEPVEHDRVAIAVPRARVPGRRAPCFANRDVLVGSEVWSDLDHYAIGMSSEEPASGTYGTCTIKNGQLRDAHGTLVAEIHCGITVYVPGILDHLGFEIGARGSDIAAEHATQDAICWHDFRDDDVAKHTRCSFSDGSHYSVAGVAAAMPEHGPLRGAAARGFFTSRTVSHFT
ncbi:MAG TPA: hypothetical protein VIV11_19135, partial [Kofleriaceae bacterium]